MATSTVGGYLPRVVDDLLDDRLSAMGAVLTEGVMSWGKGADRPAARRQRGVMHSALISIVSEPALG